MSSRITKEKREQIRNNQRAYKRSVRAEAHKLKVSPSTVQRWRKRKDSEERQRRIGTQTVTSANDLLFRELLKLTRYSYQRLVQYLSPLKAGGWSNPSYYHYLYKDKGQPLKSFDQNDPGRYSCAVHSIRVSWTSGSGKVVKGKVLFFFERHSGLIYAAAFKTRINPFSFAKALYRFEKMLPRDIESLHFVSSYLTKQPEANTPQFTTSLHLLSSLGDPSQLSVNSLVSLDEYMCWDQDIRIPLLVDPPTEQQRERVILPGKFESRVELDRHLERLCNILNLKKRAYRTRKIAPVDKLSGHFKSSRKKLSNAIRLPREFKYKYRN